MKRYLADIRKLEQSDDPLCKIAALEARRDRLERRFNWRLENYTDAEDAASETIVRGVKAIYDRVPIRKFDAWVNQIAKNVYYDTLRKRQTSVSTVEDFDELLSILSADDPGLDSKSTEILQTALEVCTDKEWLVLRLLADDRIAGLSHSALILGISYERARQLRDSASNKVKRVFDGTSAMDEVPA
jgi:RNA polymerase sigma factor (sigma-70 family)